MRSKTNKDAIDDDQRLHAPEGEREEHRRDQRLHAPRATPPRPATNSTNQKLTLTEERIKIINQQINLKDQKRPFQRLKKFSRDWKRRTLEIGS